MLYTHTLALTGRHTAFVGARENTHIPVLLRMHKHTLLIEFRSRMEKSFPAAAVRQMEIDCGLGAHSCSIRNNRNGTHTRAHAQMKMYCRKPQINHNLLSSPVIHSESIISPATPPQQEESHFSLSHSNSCD